MNKKKLFRIQILNHRGLLRVAWIGIVISFIIGWAWFTMVRMPGFSYRGTLASLSQHEITLREALQQDVQKLSGELGEHNYFKYEKLSAAANYLENSLTNAGYKVKHQQYEMGNKSYDNLEVEIIGTSKPDEIVIIGGHYDSALDSPGANDNSTGAAAVLELARNFAGKKIARTLRFVEFVNEEPPFFWTEEMGSVVYAKKCRDRNEKIVAMLSLETMGYYSNEKGSQKYPFPFSLLYPSQGDFIAFIGNPASGELVRKSIASFRNHAKFPSEGAALPEKIRGVGWSDQWSFWQQGYPGVMVTDTAVARYPYYHTPQDTPDKIQYDNLARVVAGLEGVITDLVEVVN